MKVSVAAGAWVGVVLVAGCAISRPPSAELSPASGSLSSGAAQATVQAEYTEKAAWLNVSKTMGAELVAMGWPHPYNVVEEADKLRILYGKFTIDDCERNLADRRKGRSFEQILHSGDVELICNEVIRKRFTQ